MRGAAGPGTDPWCDPTPPPPPASTGHLPEGRLGTPPPQRAHLHIHARRYLPLVGALTRPGGRQQSGRLSDNLRGVPSRASEVRAHWPWVTTVGASRDPTQPNQPPPKGPRAQNEDDRSHGAGPSSRTSLRCGHTRVCGAGEGGWWTLFNALCQLECRLYGFV